jgi:hypothetical protein
MSTNHEHYETGIKYILLHTFIGYPFSPNSESCNWISKCSSFVVQRIRATGNKPVCSVVRMMMVISWTLHLKSCHVTAGFMEPCLSAKSCARSCRHRLIIITSYTSSSTKPLSMFWLMMQISYDDASLRSILSTIWCMRSRPLYSCRLQQV